VKITADKINRQFISIEKVELDTISSDISSIEKNET
jgi:hypothetical protein